MGSSEASGAGSAGAETAQSDSARGGVSGKAEAAGLVEDGEGPRAARAWPLPPLVPREYKSAQRKQLSRRRWCRQWVSSGSWPSVKRWASPILRINIIITKKMKTFENHSSAVDPAQPVYVFAMYIVRPP